MGGLYGSVRFGSTFRCRHCTLVWNKQESRRRYWATRLSIRSHHSLTSLTPSLMGKWIFDVSNDLVLSHRALCCWSLNFESVSVSCGILSNVDELVTITWISSPRPSARRALLSSLQLNLVPGRFRDLYRSAKLNVTWLGAFDGPTLCMQVRDGLTQGVFFFF